MISAIVFSKNRAAQLDLLLRSANYHGTVLSPMVLYLATSDSYERGYQLCQHHHPQASFIPEAHFKPQLEMLLAMSFPLIMLLCDDDVFYRGWKNPVGMLGDPNIFCFSTRLGENTTYCYPLNQPQTFPDIEEKSEYFMTWRYLLSSMDFGYPGSIDGTIFRTGQLLEMIRSRSYTNPNTLEEVLQEQSAWYYARKMASFKESIVVGMPINLVNDTHRNRHEGSSVEKINERFLAGERISLDTVDPDKVNGAHTPFKLKWE